MSDILWRLCKVVENSPDPYDAGRIKVDIPGIDSNEETIDDVGWCFPLLPKLIHVRPKPGETVLVIFETINGVKDNRYYIGPVLSQPYHYNNEHFLTTALDALKDARNNLEQPPSNNKEYALTYPSEEDIALIGRKNAEVRLMENEVRIMCGHQESPDHEKLINRMNFSLNPAYIQMKYITKGISPTIKNGQLSGNEGSQINSVVNIGADSINFIKDYKAYKWFGYDENSGNVDDEFAYKQLKEFLDNSHKLVYGDMLIPFLKKLIWVFVSHTHPFSMTPPSLDENKVNLLNTEQLDRMLVDYIRLS